MDTLGESVNPCLCMFVLMMQCMGDMLSIYSWALCLQNTKHISNASHHQNKHTKGMGLHSPLECVCSLLGIYKYVHCFIAIMITMAVNIMVMDRIPFLTANILRWCTRAWTHRIVFRWFTTYMQIKVHNVVLCTHVHFGGAQCRFVLIRWCKRLFCMFVIN